MQPNNEDCADHRRMRYADASLLSVIIIEQLSLLLQDSYQPYISICPCGTPDINDSPSTGSKPDHTATICAIFSYLYWMRHRQ